MADLRTRFATLDRLPVPDLWAEVERRAMATVPAGGDAQARGPQRLTGAETTWRGARPSLGRTRSRRLVLVLLGLALVLAGGLAVGIGSGLIRIPAVTTPVPTEPPPLDAGFALQPLHIEDFSAEVSVPATWSVTGDQCCDYQEFSGPAPEGHLSVSHQSPYSATVCSPDCQTTEVPGVIPYSATEQLDALKAGVSAIAGDSGWTALPPGVLPEVGGGARLDTTAVDADGREWRRVHIVGLRDRNVVAIAWSQPADAYDERLLNAVLTNMTLPSAPVYSDGDLIDQLTGEAGFAMPLPGLWLNEEQPTVGDEPLSGVRRYGDGRVLVSIGDVAGTLGWCDPDCQELTAQTSLDTLEAAIRDGRSLGPATSTTLGGEPARMVSSEGPTDRRYVIAMHGDRPVALRIDSGEWDVAPGIVDQMVAGFRFVDPEPVPADQRFKMADGGVELALSKAWKRDTQANDVLVLGPQQLTVRVGTKKGRIVTCTRPAGPWEQCRQVRVKTLDELADAVQPAPIADHGVGPPAGRRDAGTLGGEPSVVTRIQAYEYPAKGGQEVVYIVAMHAGRPYIIRIWTSDNEATDLDSVIAGFRFAD